MKFCMSCAAGLESLLKKEIQIAGYTFVDSQPTLVRFEGDFSAIAKMNLRSRVWNKLYLELAKKKISDFDSLFDLIQTIDWSVYVQDNPIVVNALSKQSLLTSIPTVQSVSKKAIVNKIFEVQRSKGAKAKEREDWEKLFEDAKLQSVEILVHIQNNECSILLNTTGESLHKRGYKKMTGEAPINESLAAGLLLLSWWKFSEPLYDFFCGSGTIVIEATLLAKNIAPGIFRSFAFQQFSRYDQNLFTAELQSAKSKMMLDKTHTIVASDIDPQMIVIAKENAKNAGVEQFISFETKDVKDYLTWPALAWTLVSNPPYGIRLHIFDLEKLYRGIAELFTVHPKLHGGIITSYVRFADMQLKGNWKKSPFWNGWEECRFYKKSLL